MPVYALVDCHWNGVEYAADDQIDIDGLDAHALRELVRSLPVYGTAPGAAAFAVGNAAAMALALGG